MSVERALMVFAGSMVLISVGLTYWVHPNFVWLTVFVGANLLQSGFTQFCPVVIFMRRVLKLKTNVEIELNQQKN